MLAGALFPGSSGRRRLITDSLFELRGGGFMAELFEGVDGGAAEGRFLVGADFEIAA